MQLNTCEELIADLKAGKMIILMDDEDRENEGDLVIPADTITPEAINFMITHARGLVCFTLTQEKAHTLNLAPQTAHNTAAFSTAFTVSIEAAEGVSTGISAYDRARTIQVANSTHAKAQDIVQPGHIFPIIAKDGGVLTRAGHTEASVDLARLAGFQPSGVICEILNSDGTMARRPDLETFAQQHHLKIGTIADLIQYRLARERTIEKIREQQLSTAYGDFTLTLYQSIFDRSWHYAIKKGDVCAEHATFVRVHIHNVFSDLFAAHATHPHFSLATALSYLQKEENGVIVVLDSGDNPLAQLEMMTHSQEKERRTYGIGAQILIDQGVRKIRLLSTPYVFANLSGYQLEISEFIQE